jgi:hypothetical protein
MAHLGIVPGETRDGNGGERFNAYGPVRLVDNKLDDWYVKYTWYGLKEGSDCCAADAFSFHYIELPEARLLQDMLHSQERYKSISTKELTADWPKKGIGGYARRPSAKSWVWYYLFHKLAVAGVTQNAPLTIPKCESHAPDGKPDNLVIDCGEAAIAEEQQ